MLRLDGLAERKLTALSGGQRQRVALGRALAINPQILLLDEPLSNLDARIREEVRHEIKTLQQTLGITTVHVTHERQEAMVMADRIGILDAGCAAQIGTPEEIYNRPNSPFVASFMGAGNIVTLRVRGNEQRAAIGRGLRWIRRAGGRLQWSPRASPSRGGTEGSNLLPSSGESGANRASEVVRKIAGWSLEVDDGAPQPRRNRAPGAALRCAANFA